MNFRKKIRQKRCQSSPSLPSVTGRNKNSFDDFFGSKFVISMAADITAWPAAIAAYAILSGSYRETGYGKKRETDRAEIGGRKQM